LEGYACLLLRRIINEALKRDDLVLAQVTISQLSQMSKDEMLTKYLTFQLAVRSHDLEIARECLCAFAQHAIRDSSYLFACVLEVQQSNKRGLAIEVLQAILNDGRFAGHLSPLLCCMARLLTDELVACDTDKEKIARQLTATLEAAMDLFESRKESVNDKQRQELEWWTKKSYNISLDLYSNISSESLARLLAVCVRLLDFYGQRSTAQSYDRVIDRKLSCLFLSAVTLMTLARSGDQPSEKRVEKYKCAQEAIEAFRIARKDTVEVANIDQARRLIELQKFELESLFETQQWDRLHAAVRDYLEPSKIDHCDSLVNTMLVLYERTRGIGFDRTGATEMHKLMTLIVDSAYKDGMDIAKIARWIRIALAIELEESSDAAALDFLKQAFIIAKARYGSTRSPYPDNELRWLVAIAFNQAVDLFSRDESTGGMLWLDNTVKVAQYVADDGALHAHLRSKQEQLLDRADGT
jgi:hypothetical protein